MSIKINRRKLLKVLGGTAALAAVPGGLLQRVAGAAESAPAAAGKRPNILYIFTDQQHWNMLSCAGNPHVKTPAVDSLAATGVRFQRAYAANPVCAPSRTSQFLGVYPSAVGVQFNGDIKNAGVSEAVLQNSLGRLFRAGGYETAYGGKEHLPVSLETLGFDGITRDDRQGLADAAAEFIRKPHDKPWLLVASFINPHDICYQAINHFRAEKGENDPGVAWLKGEFTPQQEQELAKARISRDDIKKSINYAQAALAEALGIPEGVSNDEFFRSHAPPLPDNYEVPALEPEVITTDVLDKEQTFRGHARRTFTDEQWRLHRWAYARLTERVDAEIGKVLDALREHGLEENTVVVFSSDHGDLDAAHRLEHKSLLYEESSHVPFIISHKGVTPGGTVDDEHYITNGPDLIPTLLDFAGLAIPPQLTGRSIRPLAEGKAAPNWRKELVVEAGFGRAHYFGDTKYSLYSKGANREILVDLKADPGEMQNLAQSPEHAETLQRHRDGLRRWVETQGDAFAQEYLV